MNYTDENWGEIQFPERAKQQIKFKGMELEGGIRPTDIDGFIEYHDKIFIFYEVKGDGVDMPRGQEVALKRTVDALSEARKYAVLFVCEHNVPNPENAIFLADTVVKTVYVSGYEERQGHGYTAKKATDIWMAFCKQHGR